MNLNNTDLQNVIELANNSNCDTVAYCSLSGDYNFWVCYSTMFHPDQAEAALKDAGLKQLEVNSLSMFDEDEEDDREDWLEARTEQFLNNLDDCIVVYNTKQHSARFLEIASKAPF